MGKLIFSYQSFLAEMGSKVFFIILLHNKSFKNTVNGLRKTNKETNKKQKTSDITPKPLFITKPLNKLIN